MYPYNFKRGQRIQTNASGVAVDRAFGAHIQIAAESAVAADTDGVDIITLGADAQEITAGINNPAVPRALQVVGNVAGVVGDVVITGTNYADEVITETLALNETTAVHGAKAFKTVTKIVVPAQIHTPAAQTETIEITAVVSSDGNITLALTAAALGDASPKSVVVPVTTALDDVTKVAAAIVEALNADEDVSANFIASNELGVITLTALEPAANDDTLAFEFTDTDTTGVTAGASTNGTAGVPYDIVSVGWNDKLGLPFMLAHNTVQAAYLNNVKEAVAPTVVTDADDIEGNTIDLNSALDGTVVDIYLIV